MFRNVFFILMAFTLATVFSPYAAAADSCQPLLDASQKLATTPTHIYATVSNGRKSTPTMTEMIYAGNAVYAKLDTGWMRTKLNPQETIDRDRSQKKTGSCRYVKDESIGGETAAMYSEQSSSGKAQSQLWISKSKGLLLRQEVEIGSDNKESATHISMRYEYANVQAPRI
jgi:hypothetical protein